MQMNTMMIPLAFLLLSVLLLWIFIGTKGKWGVKLMLIVFVPSYAFMVWQSIETYRGWPTMEDLPKKAVLLSGKITEPDKRTGDSGVIYLWVVPLNEDSQSALSSSFSYQSKRGEPRAFQLPYSRGLHGILEDMLALVMEGKTVIIENDPDRPKEKGDGKNGNDGGFRGVPDPQFHILPPPKYPEKLDAI